MLIRHEEINSALMAFWPPEDAKEEGIEKKELARPQSNSTDVCVA